MMTRNRSGFGSLRKILNTPTSSANNVTKGKIYQTVINKERAGDYLGKTVQVIPHITDEIKRRMRLLENESITTSLLRKLVELLVTLKVCLTLKRSGN